MFSYLNLQAGIFMGFSITSAVFGGIIIIAYSIAIANYRDDYSYSGYRYYRKYRRSGYDEDMAYSAIILVLGIVEFATGIWASVCLCLMKPCTCCYSSSVPQQVSSLPRVIKCTVSLAAVEATTLLVFFCGLPGGVHVSLFPTKFSLCSRVP